MTYEEMRITYQSDEQMARALFAELAIAQAAHGLEQALRARAENKLNPPAPRRANRDKGDIDEPQFEHHGRWQPPCR